jgi:competence protein ComEA
MSDSSRHPHWLLRRTDQAIVAGFVVVALAATIVWWIAQSGPRGRLVEIDQAEPQTARFEVDINTADWPELIQLPSVGQTLAERIVDSRRTAGPFRSPDDLLRVNGVGQKRLEQIRPYLRPMQQNSNAADK